MDTRHMERIADMLCKEIKDIADKGELSMGDLETVSKAVGAIKDINKIKMCEGGQSYGDWRAMGSYADGMSNAMMPEGYSGRHWVSGHYSREGNSYGNSYGNNSYAGGKQMLMDEMRNMLQSDNLEPRDRDSIKRALDMIAR